MTDTEAMDLIHALYNSAHHINLGQWIEELERLLEATGRTTD